MPVGIDTSVLVAAEKQGDFEKLLPESVEGPYYIPALAATQVLGVIGRAIPGVIAR